MERDEFCKKDLDGVNEEFIVYKNRIPIIKRNILFPREL